MKETVSPIFASSSVVGHRDNITGVYITRLILNEYWIEYKPSGMFEARGIKRAEFGPYPTTTYAHVICNNLKSINIQLFNERKGLTI